MQVIDDFAAAPITHPSLVTVGSFDGVHVGHQRLLQQMKQRAEHLGYNAVVVTFHPRPQAVLAPGKPALDLITPDEKADLLGQIGVDLAVMLRFSRELAQWSAARFVAHLVTHLQMRELWVGAGSALGSQRGGDVAALKLLGQETGFEVRVVDPVLCDGAMVSSTRIRQLLLDGQIRLVTELLGRYPSLSGEVVHGAQRGRRIGFPTANVAVPPQIVLPLNGVYACFACVAGERVPAVANIGLRPTFTELVRTVEAHLLDFSGNLYGQMLRLEMVECLRSEIRFDGAAALVAQIAADADSAAELLRREQIASRCSGIALRVPGLRLACEPRPESAGGQ